MTEVSDGRLMTERQQQVYDWAVHTWANHIDFQAGVEPPKASTQHLMLGILSTAGHFTPTEAGKISTLAWQEAMWLAEAPKTGPDRPQKAAQFIDKCLGVGVKAVYACAYMVGMASALHRPQNNNT